ncbi:MAG: M14 metallopeptidase family protein [Pseudoxanthomonas sp.]
MHLHPARPASVPRLRLALSLALAMSAGSVLAAVPSPKAVLGHDPGDDYYLANYEDSLKYFHALEASSDHIKMFKAGRTTQGRTMEYAVISAPENIANFDKIKATSRQLADSRGLTLEQAKALSADSKIIVHIDGGMHASEVSDHQLPLALAHHLLSHPDDPEVQAIMKNVVLVLWPTLNPDGQDMIVKWYRDHADPKAGPVKAVKVDGKWKTPNRDPAMPWLYQEYVGHDNNRDGYLLNMIESQSVSAAEQEISPAIWYSQHQSAPFPARIWMPPFADPISSNINPRIRQGTTQIGINMISRFALEGKPGAIAEARFDNWYPGFMDYTQVFRHTISYFTETAHDSATPRIYSTDEFPEGFKDMKALVMYPDPWKGGLWTLKDSVNYMLTASLSTLETAVKYRDQILFNRYMAGRETIAEFSNGTGPYAWVIPGGQPDAPAAALLAQKMVQQGIEVSQATASVTLGGKSYPAGSWVIPMNQPFAGLVQELFERQKYPDAVLTGKGGNAAELPYDTTGWTLPLQFGVAADPITASLPADLSASLHPVAKAANVGGVSGEGAAFALSRQVNASFAAVNLALAQGARLAIATAPVKTVNGDEAGAFVLTGITREAMARIATDLGVDVVAQAAPAAAATRLAKVGVYRQWGSNIDEGWTRWLLEQYHYAPKSVYNKDMQAGSLKSKYDVLVLPDMGGRGRSAEDSLMNGFSTEDQPAAYAGGIGDKGAKAIKQFVNDGGTLVVFSKTSDAAIKLLDLPVTNVLAGLKPEQFFCSGALLKLELGQGMATAGLPSTPTGMFESGPAFSPKAGFKGQVIASYPKGENPLLSGMLLHPEAIQGKAAAVEIEVGKGKVYLYGFRPQWRGQSQGTYKFLFNTLYVPQP